MILIFAKHGTDEKVLITCTREETRKTQLMLEKEHGGQWLWVDQLHSGEEYLKFNDGLEYRGFHVKKERYFHGAHKGCKKESSR